MSPTRGPGRHADLTSCRLLHTCAHITQKASKRDTSGLSCLTSFKKFLAMDRSKKRRLGSLPRGPTARPAELGLPPKLRESAPRGAKVETRPWCLDNELVLFSHTHDLAPERGTSQQPPPGAWNWKGTCPVEKRPQLSEMWGSTVSPPLCLKVQPAHQRPQDKP